MRTLNAPLLEARDVYTGISSARRSQQVKERLLGARQLVFAAYDAYTTAKSDVHTLQRAATPPATDADLKGNYNYLIKSAKEAWTAIMENNLGGRCPLCGQGRATTLDHYLPKSAYPEFSVLPLNLIPSCAECNRKKSSFYADAGRALFLHTYLDEVPVDKRFLFTDIEVHGSDFAVSFRVKPPPSFQIDLRQRIVTHFERLGLAKYYAEEGVNEITERCGSIGYMLDDGMDSAEVGKSLSRDAASVAAAKGVNYWLYALLDAMACSEDICAGAFRN